jgi:molybdenum cofactor biosynthesis enzyme MoaA
MTPQFAAILPNLIPGTARLDSLFYVTVLSNFARGYDKYRRTYDKAGIPESTYADKFFLLDKCDLLSGVGKASLLLEKLAVPGNRLVALETRVNEDQLHPNLRTGVGRYVEGSWIEVVGIHFTDDEGALFGSQIEEVYALALKLHLKDGRAYESLVPRSLSFLPVANACQARCPFCFSKASVSAETASERIDWIRITEVLHAARQCGAQRVVITGGGEPSLLGEEDLERLIRESAAHFRKVVLISNGFKWGAMPAKMREASIHRLDEAGLTVLALSRHHFDNHQNAHLMRLDTQSERVAETWSAVRSGLSRLRLRWICVLQRGGIENRDTLIKYLDWAVEGGVEEICFKELYVSASIESEYFDRAVNRWSAENQASLRIVIDLANEVGWSLVEQLPWGAPIFEGHWRGRLIRVAAYTEPSVFWELSNGTCRSWNLMADGRCLASLEDRNSGVLPHGLRELQTITR